MHLEFIVAGTPISNQSQGSPALVSWRSKVRAAAAALWNQPTLQGNLKGTIINFHKVKKPTLDLDNMSKPIFDVLEKLVYDNDRQIHQAELTHVNVGSLFVFVGVSPLIAAAVQGGQEFVFVRIEDALDPFPLPQG